MGSASVSGGFGKRVPNNPAFQKTRSRASGQQNNTFQSAADLGRSNHIAQAPAMTGGSQNNYHGLSSEVASGLYKPDSSESDSGSRSFYGYAGFWIRVLAYLIDCAFLIIAATMIGKIALLAGIATLPPEALASGISPDSFLGALSATSTGVLEWPVRVLGTVYFMLMEASPLQGTLGKLALGLRVGDINGNQISVVRSICRYFAKILSAITLGIGFIMAGCNSKKQALHDMVCSTYVVK